VILERPPEFTELDRERLGTLAPLLDSESMRAVRETSAALTAWLRDGGGALRASGELIGARAFLEFATERDSTDVETLVQLSLVHIQRQPAAAGGAAEGTEIDPFHGGVHYNLAAVLEAEGDLAGAGGYRAASGIPDGSAARVRLLYARGDHVSARLELEALRATSPASEATRFLEGLLRSS
jgi:hypothetical protein